MSKKVSIAVRDFAVPLRRQGNLGFSTGTSSLPLDLGHLIHEQIQTRLKNSEPAYQAEYSLQQIFSEGGYDLLIRGRCDGYYEQETPLLEEIKSTHNLEALQSQLAATAEHPYQLQALMYAYIFWLRTGKTVQVQLRLVSVQTLAEIVLPLAFAPEVFADWVQARCRQIAEDLDRYAGMIKTRKRLAKKLFFPFTRQRPSQDRLIESVSTALESGRHLLLQAPTGLGKTAGVLFPALSFALAQGSPVIYIAPKNSQFKAAEDLAALFHRQRIKLKVLVLTSKSKACRLEAVHCHECPYGTDYYSKVDDRSLALRDGKKNLWDRRYFQRISEDVTVCPYELSMERMREADLIICDYNYVFAPNANFFNRYLDPILPVTSPVLVIDEAHNLPDRVRENYSPEVRLSTLRACLDEGPEALRPIVSEALALMERIRPAAAEARIKIDPEAVKRLLEGCWGLMVGGWSEGDPVFRFFIAWSDLYKILLLADEEMPLLYKREPADECLKALCIDPSPFMRPVLAMFRGVIAFSATLKPFPYYRDLSGFDPENTETIELSSPFPRANKKILIIPQVRTSFRERGLHYQRIAEIIKRVVALQPGPYLVFFSSYDFLRRVQKELEQEPLDWSLFVQNAAMNSRQMQHFWDILADRSGIQLILAVQGGSLAEGIDFKGQGLRAVFVVGPALPSASFERQLMQDFLQKKYGQGRAYAQIYPAMAKSIQAAGRIVRDEKERGLIILMDPRFLETEFQGTMPEDWFQSSAQELVPQKILREIEDFWEESPPA